MTWRLMLGRVVEILSRMPQGRIVGAEIGVCRGTMSVQLLRARRDLTLYMIDNWLGQTAQPERYRPRPGRGSGLASNQTLPPGAGVS